MLFEGRRARAWVSEYFLEHRAVVPVNQLSITKAYRPEELASARMLFEEYAASLGIDLCFQGFDKELATLPGRYAPPEGRLLLAFYENELAGCVALQRLEADVCEMKRLYVRPAFQGLGVGRMLVERVILEAGNAGYRRMRLDTLPTMTNARTLYRKIGFREIAPYTSNPVDGVAYLELDLKPSAHDA